MKNITVLGAGTMGHGIAQISAMAGYNVWLRDIEQRLLENAMDKIKWSLNKLSLKNKLSKTKVEQIFSRIKPVIDLKESIKNTDLIIEAVPEVINLKKRIYCELDSIITGDVIFASNTSTLPITEIASVVKMPEKFIGIHFFNPPQLMKLVEIIPGKYTSTNVIDTTLDYVKSLDKDPVICRKDVPGFISNRLFIPLVHEVCHIMDRQENTLMEIDAAFKFKLNFPMGIFELADFTGIDVIHKATLEMLKRDQKVINPHKKIESLFKEKKFGKKSGEGFYNYSGEQYKRSVLSKELAKRCNSIQIIANLLNSAAWLITNKVCNSKDVEKTLSLGFGLKKPFFGIVKEFGIKNLVDELKRLSNKYGYFYEPNKAIFDIIS